jgi:ribonuclease BN (tRNA processing enzyme)
MKLRTRSSPPRLTFLGTRGEIPLRSHRHWRHSSLLVRLANARVMVDCGADWLNRVDEIAPTAIVLTHAHEDHAAGLRNGSPCPVYATRKTWQSLRHFPIADRRTLPLRRETLVDGVPFEPFQVDHSVRAPAVGFRISIGHHRIFYVPDVARIRNLAATFRGVGLYIGDGATLKHSMVRQKASATVGHASIVAQLAWCAKAGIRSVIFTHCGSGIVRDRHRRQDIALKRLAAEHGIFARIASDGDELVLEGLEHRRTPS